MVTDKQVRRMKQMIETGKKQTIAALKTGMDEKTARKYIRSGKLQSQLKQDHIWRKQKGSIAVSFCSHIFELGDREHLFFLEL